MSQNIRLLRELTHYKYNFEFNSCINLSYYSRLHLFNMIKYNLNHTSKRFMHKSTLYSCPRKSALFLDKLSKGSSSIELHNCSKLKYYKFNKLMTNSLNSNKCFSVLHLKDFRNGKFYDDMMHCSEEDMECKKENALTSTIGEFIKPVKPSVDDIQVNNSVIKCGDRYAINKSMAVSSVLSDISNIVRTTTFNKSLPTLLVHEDILSDKINPNNNKLSLDNPSVLYCSPSNANLPQSDGDNSSNVGKPSEEQLSKVYHTLCEELPNLFARSLNYTLYSTDIVFENRIRGTRTEGIYHYVRQVSLLRIIGHIKYAFVKFEILKITQHAEDSTIRVRWRIIGVSALKSLPMIFTLKSYTLDSAKEKMDDWYDGFSTFYVGPNGLIYKHVADKMMPDEELLLKKPSFASRLAALIGMTPKTPAAAPPAVTSSRVENLKDKTRILGPNKTLVLTLVLNDNVGSLM